MMCYCNAPFINFAAQNKTIVIVKSVKNITRLDLCSLLSENLKLHTTKIIQVIIKAIIASVGIISVAGFISSSASANSPKRTTADTKHIILDNVRDMYLIDFFMLIHPFLC